MVFKASLRRRLERLERAAGLDGRDIAIILLDTLDPDEGQFERKQQEYLAEHGQRMEDIQDWFIVEGFGPRLLELTSKVMYGEQIVS